MGWVEGRNAGSPKGVTHDETHGRWEKRRLGFEGEAEVVRGIAAFFHGSHSQLIVGENGREAGKRKAQNKLQDHGTTDHRTI